MSKTIAIIGASRDSSKVSHKAVKAYQSLGWKVFPVNPNAGEVAGVKAYGSFDKLPEKAEVISVYLPPDRTLDFLSELQGYAVKILYLNPGSADDRVRARAKGLNLPVAEACSIVSQGLDPANF